MSSEMEKIEKSLGQDLYKDYKEALSVSETKGLDIAEAEITPVRIDIQRYANPKVLGEGLLDDGLIRGYEVGPNMIIANAISLYLPKIRGNDFVISLSKVNSEADKKGSYSHLDLI